MTGMENAIVLPIPVPAVNTKGSNRPCHDFEKFLDDAIGLKFREGEATKFSLVGLKNGSKIFHGVLEGNTVRQDMVGVERIRRCRNQAFWRNNLAWSRNEDEVPSGCRP